MTKKSKAQIARMTKRAEARGESYEPPRVTTEPALAKPASSSRKHEDDADLSPAEHSKLKAARQLENELKKIDEDEEMKAKVRRSAKRRAEAIASEAAGVPAAELIAWYANYKELQKAKDSKETKNKKESTELKKNRNPYIAFVGQLNFGTTKESLFQHIRESLGEEFDVSPQTVHIRLLTDAKSGRSRGMAFVEVTNPELLYALLRLHQTFLEGRRINVERTAGGKASSETKKQKLEQFRKEQEEYLSSVVDKMLQDFYEQGSIQRDELDEGVIGLLKRHSANVVQAALERYVESDGKNKDNSSAYLSFLVGKMAEEGIFEKSDDSKGKRSNESSGGTDKRPPKKPRPTESILETEGVDMNRSKGNGRDMSKIFPSYSRGRGKGRGGKALTTA